MKWWHNYNLSQSDMESLQAADIRTYFKMIRQRIIVDFGNKDVPEFRDLHLSEARDLFYIKELGSTTYEFWFLDERDLMDFKDTLLEYKITGTEEASRSKGVL
jgi:hypothetical protein